MSAKHDTDRFSLWDFLHFDFRFVLSKRQGQSQMTYGQTFLMFYGFPCGGCSKDIVNARNTLDPCCVRQRSISTITDRQTHNTSVFAFRIHLWHVSSKYPANRNSVPLNPLNKYKEKPATNMQTIWNETSLCVFWSRFSLGCSCVCGLQITNPKTSAMIHSSNDCGDFIFSDCRAFVDFFCQNTCRQGYILGHIWIQLTIQLHICFVFLNYP